MARTGQELVDRVRTITGDKSAAQFNDLEILRWATDAQRRHIRYTGPTVERSTLVTIAGTNSYVDSAGFTYLDTVYLNGHKLQHRTVQELDLEDSYRRSTPVEQGTPVYFWSTENTLNFYPAPDTTGQVIIHRVVPRAADVLLVATAFTVADDYFETIVRYCLQMAAEWGEDWPAAQWFKTDFKERVAEDMFDTAMEGRESYPVVRDAPGEYW